ncbi:MAG TPA: PIN domain-containing protein [Parapedobacter sp.]|uniref:PIN domain-containing protein n=1 Tax=Parapedobacter sp. TaxID=1958893 RepID=UPI002D18F56F|nr:PIN domain-containing protein [Parapedobacter sp.]HWK57307.1 PIN domain-containing protein [Parapedobacter sp.]
MDKFYLEKVFPDADAVFQFRYKSLSELNGNAIFVFDTMVLLTPYFTSKESVDDFRKIFTELKTTGRLLIPARVAREFAKNRGKKLAEAYNKIVESQQRLNRSEIRFEKFPIFEADEDYLALKEAESRINALKQTYREKLESLSKKLKEWKWLDPVTQMYQEIFTKELIIELKEDQSEIEKRLEHRFDHEIPPGFKKQDRKKLDNGIGDLIVWQTTLEIGRDHKSDIIFVTNESHNDWFYREQDTAISPRIELLDEFRRVTGGKSISIIDFQTFLEIRQAKTSTVDEVKEYVDEERYSVHKNHASILEHHILTDTTELKTGLLKILVAEESYKGHVVGKFETPFINPPLKSSYEIVTNPSDGIEINVFVRTGTKHDFHLGIKSMQLNVPLQKGVYEIEYEFSN